MNIKLSDRAKEELEKLQSKSFRLEVISHG